VSLVLLIIASAIFSGAETAFFSLTRAELQTLRQSPTWTARRLVQLLRRPRETLITILLANESVNCAMAVLGAELASQFFQRPIVASLASVALITPIVVVFGELVPKNLAVSFAARLSPILAVPMATTVWLAAPVRRLLSAIADTGVRLFGGDPGQVRAMIVEEEFRQMVDLGNEAGALSDSEREWIHGVFTISDRAVSDVMTPVGHVFRVPLLWTPEQILSEVQRAQFSRVPVYHDNPDDIVGLLYVRDLVLWQIQRERGQAKELEEIVRPVLFVTQQMSIESVLQEFQKSKIHLAIVLDDTQHMLGVATMDDVLDALIGGKTRALS